jgi:DNA-binding NarL/FixJ family response regulator
VLELLAEGLSNKAIAAALGVSDQTVKFHVASISGKLGASNRTEAVRMAVRRGLITM